MGRQERRGPPQVNKTFGSSKRIFDLLFCHPSSDFFPIQALGININ